MSAVNHQYTNIIFTFNSFFPEYSTLNARLKLKNLKKMITKIKTLDLFAGIGGMRLGLEQACEELKINHEAVMYVEHDKKCRETYDRNFPGTQNISDIQEIIDIDNQVPDHDILAAGFPCQPYSLAGKQLGLQDKRGKTLFDQLKDIINVKQPKAFILENVKNIMSIDDGNTWKYIIEELSKNYQIPIKQVIKSVDFGLPQNRQRVYIVGIHKKIKPELFEVGIGPNREEGQPNDMFRSSPYFLEPFPDNRVTREKTEVQQILQSLSKEEIDEYTISQKLWDSHKARKERNLNKVPATGFGYGFVTPSSKYTRTLTHRYYKDGAEILLGESHDQQNVNKQTKPPRKLTPHECKLLQGFPNEFQEHTSKVEAYKQFGNAVSVPVVKHIAKRILKLLKEEKNKMNN